MTTNDLIYPTKTTSLGNGLDTRINRDLVDFVQSKVWLMYSENVDSTERMLDNLLTGSEAYSFPTSAVDMDFSSTNSGDTSLNVQFEYYETKTSETITTEIISTDASDGQAQVNLNSGNGIFRIERIIMLDPNFSGNIWVGQSSDTWTAGKPDNNLYASCESSIRVSRLPFLYCPPNHKLFSTNLEISHNVINYFQTSQNLISGAFSNTFEQVDLRLLRFPNISTPTLTYEIYKKYLTGTTNSQTNFLSTPPIPGSATQYVTAQETSGSNPKSVFILTEFLLIKEFS